MSESYISDQAPTVYKDNSRSSADDRYARLNIVQQIESELGLEGPELNFATAQRLKRFNIRTMTPVEMFKYMLIKKYRDRKYNISDDEIKTLSEMADKIPYIQFKNTLGILYAMRFVYTINNEGKDDWNKLITEAKENSVPLFDILRYYRLLRNLDLVSPINRKIQLKI